MCSERDSPLKHLYRQTHAKLARLLSFTLSGLCDRARHPRQYFGWPCRAKRGRPITHEWIDPWTLLLPGQHRWAQGGATDEPREFRLAGSRQDKRLERAIPLTTHLCINVVREKINSLATGRWCWEMAPSHYLNQWGLVHVIVNCTLGNKLQWNFHQNTTIWNHKNPNGIVVCNRAAIMFTGLHVFQVIDAAAQYTVKSLI